MAVQRKVFRIEQMSPIAAAQAAIGSGAVSTSGTREILAELKTLQELVERRTVAATAEGDNRRLNGPDRLDEPAHNAQDALNRIKCEIAALHAIAFSEPAPARVTRELDAVAESAERATQVILDAAEDIEDAANNLSASLKRQQEQALALDIQDQVLRIFEACNFQDLSGQRIAKVLATLRSVEERFTRMMEICGKIEAIKDDSIAASGAPGGTTELHGPRLDHDSGHVSQDDVDKLFATG